MVDAVFVSVSLTFPIYVKVSYLQNIILVNMFPVCDRLISLSKVVLRGALLKYFGY